MNDNNDCIEAALLQLQASARELLGLMKQITQGPMKEGDPQALAQYAARLANVEGGYFTMVQHGQTLQQSPPTPEVTPVEAQEIDEEEHLVITPERSPTMARVDAVHTATKKALQENE